MQELMPTILTSAVVATVAAAAFNAWLETRKSKWSTKLDALKTAVALEGYAIECADKLADHDMASSSGGHAGSYIANVPELPELVVSVGFLRTQKAKVANRLMIFPQEVRQAEQAVAFWWDVLGDLDCSRNAAVEQASEMGLSSLNLSRDIRSAYKLPKRDLVFGKYNVRKVLEDFVSEAKEKENA